MPNAATRPLFEAAKELGDGFYLGYAELTREKGEPGVSTPRSWSILGADHRKVSKNPSAGACDHVPRARSRISKSAIRGRHRGVPGLARWPRTSDVHLQRSALARDFSGHRLARGRVVASATTRRSKTSTTANPSICSTFHHLLSVQAGAYQNAAWVLAAAKCGAEDGFADDRRLGDRRADRRDCGAGLERGRRGHHDNARSISTSANTCAAPSSISTSTVASNIPG